MKAFSLVLYLLACAAAFASTAIPANAQLPWWDEYVTYDSADSGGTVTTTPPGTASYTISPSNMEVTSSASGSGYAPPGYFGQAAPVEGFYDITVQWGGYDPPTEPPPSEFVISLSGNAQASSSVNSPSPARARSTANTYGAGADTGPPNMSNSVSNNVPPGTEIILTTTDTASGTVYQQMRLQTTSYVSSLTYPPDGQANSSTNASATLVVETVTPE